jgi:hypothetical protein
MILDFHYPRTGTVYCKAQGSSRVLSRYELFVWIAPLYRYSVVDPKQFLSDPDPTWLETSFADSFGAGIK